MLDKEADNDKVERVTWFWLFTATSFIVDGEQTNNVWWLPPVLLVLGICIIKDCCANGLNPLPAAGDPVLGSALIVLCGLNKCCWCKVFDRWLVTTALLILLGITSLLLTGSLKIKNT